MQEKSKVVIDDPKDKPKPEEKPKTVTVYTGGGGGEKQVPAELIIETQNNGVK